MRILFTGVAGIAFLVVLGGTPSAARPQDADEPFVLSLDTRLVQVDVVVLDREGPVEGLSAADFRLFDDGVERSIQVFNVTRSAPAGEPPPPLPEGIVSNRIDWQGRTPETATVVLMDRFNTLALEQPFMAHQTRDFLDDAIRNNDRVAVYELSEIGLTLLGDYRTPPERILGAVRETRPRHSLALENSLGALDDFQLDQQLQAFTGNEDAATPFDMEISDYFLELRTANTSAALEAIARQLSELPGRKNLVWLASSFPFTFNPHQNPHLFRAVPASALDRIEEVARMMTDANVAIYPVDVRGLGEAEPTELGIMTTLADMTGGRASYNTNGLANAMRQAVRDAEVTYTLGFYVSEDETDTGFHELSVEVDRPEVDVRHRGGYYGFGGEAPALDLPGLDETLVSTFDATSLGLLASASPSEAAPGTFDLAIIADVNDMGLSQVEERWVGSLTGRLFFYGTEDQDGRVLPVETYPIVLTEELLLTARATGFVITRNVDTDGQPGFLRLVLQDGTNGATGSLWVPLDYD